MGESAIVPMVISIVSLLLIATVSAILLKHLKFPYTIGLVLVGIILGLCVGNTHYFEQARHLKLSPEFILYIILPTLVFEAAIHIDSRRLDAILS